MTERKTVKENLKSIELYEIIEHGYTPDDVIAQMRRLKSIYPGRDIYFELEFYGHDGGTSITLWERRAETDKEYAARLKKEEKDALAKEKLKAKQEEQERKEYLRLKKKYG